MKWSFKIDYTVLFVIILVLETPNIWWYIDVLLENEILNISKKMLTILDLIKISKLSLKRLKNIRLNQNENLKKEMLLYLSHLKKCY